MKLKNKDKGVTLVALVITIVILLILAGITISTLTGDNGLFKRAQQAKEKTKESQNEEEKSIEDYISKIDDLTEEPQLINEIENKVVNTEKNTKLIDSYGNKLVLPVGFKVVVDETTNYARTVDKGIVIEDETNNETKGSQFVWIPVGNVYLNNEQNNENTKKIKLDRYEFDSSTGEPSTYEGDFEEEDNGNKEIPLKNYGNAIARNITNFKTSVIKNGGFYIGRYEARTNTERTDENNSLTTITERGSSSDYVYNFVSQVQAAELSQKMYGSTKNFTSDLINSYAWDTATVFLKNFGNDSKYPIKTSINKELAPSGTNNQSTKDVQCNVYDMSSNIFEWTTETSNVKDTAGIFRGGALESWYWTSYRINDKETNSAGHIGFRVIMYI